MLSSPKGVNSVVGVATWWQILPYFQLLSSHQVMAIIECVVTGHTSSITRSPLGCSGTFSLTIVFLTD